MIANAEAPTKSTQARQIPVRLKFLVAAAGVCLLALGLVSWMRRPVPLYRMSVSQLTAELGSDEVGAFEAQGELLRRPGGKDVRYWEERLGDPRSRIRFLAVDAIARTHSPDSGRLLATGLSDPDSRVRIEAVHALQDQDHDAGIRIMLAALRDDDTDVREAAARQMQYYKDQRTIPGLLRTLRDPDRSTALFASAALRHITGRRVQASYRDSTARFAHAIDAWDGWWRVHKGQYTVDPALEDVAPVSPMKRFSAPPFHVTAAGGKSYSLDSLRGKTVLLNFWGVGCDECVAEMRDLQRIAKERANEGVVVLALEAGSADDKALRAFAASHSLTFPLASAPDAVLEEYGHVHAVPVTFLIDGQGIIRYEWEGQRDYVDFDAGLRRVISGN